MKSKNWLAAMDLAVSKDKNCKSKIMLLGLPNVRAIREPFLSEGDREKLICGDKLR